MGVKRENISRNKNITLMSQGAILFQAKFVSHANSHKLLLLGRRAHLRLQSFLSPSLLNTDTSDHRLF